MRDFLRDFRGDTVHPSTLEILDELGMLERFLERPHNRLSTRRAAHRRAASGRSATFATSPTPAPFIALMPQWEFLDFLRDEAAAYPGFALEMKAPVTGFIEEDGRVAGVRLADGRELRARLVIAADGRALAAARRELLPLEDLGAPMDVFWFRLPKAADAGRRARAASIAAGRLLALIDRGDYWQCAYVFAKGTAEALRARGHRRVPRARSPRPRRSWADSVGELDELGPGPAADGRARPADPLAPARPARDRRRRPRHVADRRDRHQPRDPGRGRGGQHPRRAAGARRATSIRCSAGSSTAGCCRPG